MFNKDELIMIYTMLEGSTFRGKDVEKIVGLFDKLDKMIQKLVNEEKAAK